jgi:predicted oxidoreductase
MGIVFPSTVDTSVSHLSDTLNWFLTVLGTSYIDIVLLHYPSSFTDASAIASLFAKWKDSGLVKNFGVSNHYPSSRKVLQSKLDLFGIKLVTNEVEVSAWNPGYLNYDNSIVDDAYISGFRVLGWSSMGGDPIGGLNRLFVRKGERQLKILRALGDVAIQLGRR